MHLEHRPCVLFLLAVLCFIAGVTCRSKQISQPDDAARTLEAEQDRVSYLPGWGQLNFRLDSGYIPVSEEHQRAYFYVFAEATKVNPLKAPVVLWLNGGPGCSSLGGGFLSELGPFYPRKDGKTLQANPFAWNQHANVIFLESPAFVGFSYSNTSSDIKTGDKQTAVDNHNFLKGFFKRHAVHAASPFWITGESYGGHYLPQLAYEIVSDPTNTIKFQGFLLGNPLTDAVIDSQGALQSWYAHGMISDDSYTGALASCNFSNIDPLHSNNLKAAAQLTANTNEDACSQIVEQAETELGSINIYDIYEDICLPARATAPIAQMAKLTVGHPAFAAWRHAAKTLTKAQSNDPQHSTHTAESRLRHKVKRTLAEPSRSEYPQPQPTHAVHSVSQKDVDRSNIKFDQSNNNIDQSNNNVDQSNPSFWSTVWRKLRTWFKQGGIVPVAVEDELANDDVSLVDPCVDTEVATYLNAPEVQAALHANTTGQVPGPWADCNENIQYSEDDVTTSMMPLYPKLIDAGVKIVIYSGDVDGILPTLGTRTWVRDLGLKVISKWHPWTDSAGQPGGWAEVYEKNVAIVTVRNAGHMVPYTQPRRALDLFECIVLDNPSGTGPVEVAKQFGAESTV